MNRVTIRQRALSSGVVAICLTVFFASTVAVAASRKQAAGVSAAVAARFLEQSSWGPTASTIADVETLGLQDYLQLQFTAPTSLYTTPLPNDLASMQKQFFVHAVLGQDQLRQRVAFALSEIIVISGIKNKDATSLSLWMNMLQNDAFGNFFTILNDVTLSPSMGYYLDMANNNGCTTKCRPNENYAREVLQLFSIGLQKLNVDGTPILDNSGNPIPTYGQAEIKGFGQLFTGWSYPPKPGINPHFFNGPYYSGPMLPYQKHYSKSTKTLLDSVQLPAGDIQADLATGMMNIFGHPNVAPFICQQLIQKLVTSNPSPAYVGRVAQVFNDNGSGVRGDMQAVVSAILLDPEARRGDDPTQDQASDGHLREPLLHILASMRAVNATTDGANLASYASTMLQPPFLSPSVFNFYPPNFQLSGTSLLAPEFKIQNSNTTMSRINFVNDLIYGAVGSGTTIDISAYVTAGADINNLLDLVNTNLMHGAMSSDMRTTLSSALSAIPDATRRARAALYLVESSSQFQVEH